MDAASFFANLGFSAFTVVLLLFFVLVLSAYVKIVTVLGIVRVGFGTDGLPSAFVTGGFAIVLAFFVMYPTLIRSSTAMDQIRMSQPKLTDQLRAAAFNAGLDKWKEFLRLHAHQAEVERFSEIAQDIDRKHLVQGGQQVPKPRVLKGYSADSWRILAPAFLVSELKEAFATGLSLFLPFLVIELLVANVLAAVGLERMNPSLVSFPFKLLLFVMADGWTLITTNLVATYA